MGFGHFFKMISKFAKTALPIIDSAAQFIAKKVAPVVEDLGSSISKKNTKWGQGLQKFGQTMENVGNNIHKWYSRSPQENLKGLQIKGG